MNKYTARRIAKRITNEQLEQLLRTARERITDWKQSSRLNQKMNKDFAWYVLARNFDKTKSYGLPYKTFLVREYSEYLPSELAPKKYEKHKKTVVSSPTAVAYV